MYEYQVKEVIKVVDGDTVDVVFDLGFSMFSKQRVRLDGIDTPETHTTDEEEKRMGMEAKAFVENWVASHKKIKAVTSKDDKYGRILAKLYAENGGCLNEIMVAKGYAWGYDGGTKHKDLKVLKELRAGA